MNMRSLDTSPDALEAQRSAFADLGPEARFRAALEMSESVRQICLSGLRGRHPDASERELLDRFVEQLHGPGPEAQGVTLAAFLDRLTSILEEADIAYMLTGSLAAAYYAEPRATRDVHLAIAVSPGQVAGLMNRLDRAYVERWVDELGLDREWARLVEEFDPREAE